MKHIQRTFIPGSEWIYLKLYTGEKTADDILSEVIHPIVKELQKKQYIKKWFFIRYADPGFHLRFRILLKDIEYFGEAMDIVYKKINKWNRNELIRKVQMDTYNRELERYGRDLIEEAESVFYADSECFLSIFKKLNSDENYRWMIALKLIDELLSDFHLGIKEKQMLMEIISKSFKTEFGFNEYNSKQFNIKFRENKINIERILNGKEKTFVHLLRPITKRTKELIPVIEQIRIKSGKERNIQELLKSYLHMMINRFFRSENRMYELILYDFMLRYYKSEIAKKKYHPI